MSHMWRNPLLPVGITLFLIGVGNWGVSLSKVAQYKERIAARPMAPVDFELEDFRDLSFETNATLLEPLRRGATDYSMPHAKVEFYSIVHTGGRLLVLIGLALVLIALTTAWRERDEQRT